MPAELSAYSDYARKQSGPQVIEPGTLREMKGPNGERVVIACLPDNSQTVISYVTFSGFERRGIRDVILGRSKSPIFGDPVVALLNSDKNEFRLDGGGTLSWEYLRVKHL
jgi:hypothetical protein